MKLLSENQLVGTAPGMAVFRNLYEDDKGERHSVPTSKEFWVDEERRKIKGKPGRHFPSREKMFAKHKLPEQSN